LTLVLSASILFCKLRFDSHATEELEKIV